MANLMKMKRSSVPGKVPTTADLDLGEIAINTYDGKVYMKKNVSGVETIVLLTGAGAGDVLGPASSGDKAIARFSGTGGKTIQNSSATIDDSGNITSLTHQATGTGANKMPVGTDAQRPTGEAGMYRMNSTSGEPEWYDASSSSWVKFRKSSIYTVEYLIVAGGGGGGGNRSGGGGAGGYISGSTPVSPDLSVTVTVGGGGAVTNQGGNSSISGWNTAVGGGTGGSPDANLGSAVNGGSGGGGATNAYTTAGSGTSGQGNSGGNGSGSVGGGGGGGGGANAAGVAGTTSAAGNGGAGKQWLNGSYYSGGGGGGKDYDSGTAGTGGTGGGGNGQRGSGASATSGSANTGGGGGGGGGITGSVSGSAAPGGSGIVIFRYAGGQRATGGTVTSAGGYTYHTFTSSGSITF